MNEVLVPMLITLRVALSASLLVGFVGTLCAWSLAGKRSVPATLADYLLSIPLFFLPR